MARMNWDRVRRETQIRRHGSAPVESGMVTAPPFQADDETEAFDIRCNSAAGDHCTTYVVNGVQTLAVMYRLGGNFHSLPMIERKKRLARLYKALGVAVGQLTDVLEREYKATMPYEPIQSVAGLYSEEARQGASDPRHVVQEGI